MSSESQLLSRGMTSEAEKKLSLSAYKCHFFGWKEVMHCWINFRTFQYFFQLKKVTHYGVPSSILKDFLKFPMLFSIGGSHVLWGNILHLKKLFEICKFFFTKRGTHTLWGDFLYLKKIMKFAIFFSIGGSHSL